MARTFQSTAPAAIKQLVATFGAIHGMPDLLVIDGPRVGGPSATEVLLVGYTGERMAVSGSYPEPDAPEAESQDVMVSGLGGWPQEETYSIRCAVKVRRRNAADVAAARTRAFEIFNAAGQAVADDPRLNRTVMLASIGSWAVTQTQHPKGVEVTLTFDVDCRAFAR